MEIIGFLVILCLGAFFILHALIGTYVIYSFSGIFKYKEIIHLLVSLFIGIGLGYIAIENAPFTIIMK